MVCFSKNPITHASMTNYYINDYDEQALCWDENCEKLSNVREEINCPSCLQIIKNKNGEN